MKEKKVCTNMDHNYLPPGQNQKAYLMLELTAPVTEAAGFSLIKRWKLSFQFDKIGLCFYNLRRGLVVLKPRKAPSPGKYSPAASSQAELFCVAYRNRSSAY